jgi:hypothetical protein
MNTRRLSATAATSLLTGVIMVAGCSTPSNSAQPNPGPTPSTSDQRAASPPPDQRDIVRVVSGEASLKEDYPTIRELAGSKNVVAIVRGTVSSTTDVYLESFAFRILSVRVSEGFHGRTGQQISVLEDGGVVPYAKAAADIPAKDGDPSTPRGTEGYVDFRFMGARHSEVGDEVVLFLGTNPNSGTTIETEYSIISSVHGRFTFDPTTHTFVRALGRADEQWRAGFVTSADVGKLRSEIAAARG